MGKTKTKIIGETVEEVKPSKKGKKEYSISIPGITDEETLTTPEKEDVIPAKAGIQKEDKSNGSRIKYGMTKKDGKKKESKKQRSQKYLKTTEEIDKQSFSANKSKPYSLNEAVETVKKASYSKFTGSLEIHINTRVTGIRGLVTLPYISGKKLKILAFGQDAEKSGADTVGDDNKLEEILKNKVDFDLLITTAAWMPKLAKVARVLGPKGLMPNPKNGTIVTDLKKAVEGFQAGKTEYKSEPKAMVMHLGLGKLDQPTEQLSENVKVLLQTIGKSRIAKVTLAPTMGPGVKLDLSSI